MMVTSLARSLWLSLLFPLVLIHALFLLPQLSGIRLLLLLLLVRLLLLRLRSLDGWQPQPR